MFKQIVVLFLLVLVTSGCASTRSAQRDDSAPRVAQVIGVGQQRHCH